MARRVDWLAVRIAFESGCGVEDLCDRFTVRRRTLMKRLRAEGWTASVASAPAPSRPPCRKRPMLSRLFQALEKTMSDLEDRLQGQAGSTAADRERDAKLLGSMAALYEKLKEMQADERNRRKPRGSDPITASADHLRDALAARLDGLRRTSTD